MTYGNHKFLYEEGLMSWNVKKRKGLLRQMSDWLRSTLPAKYASLTKEREEILNKASEGHGQDENQMLDHGTRIVAKAIGEDCEEDDNLGEEEKMIEKRHMKIIEDEEFMIYFKGKKTPRQTFTPFGKFSKDIDQEEVVKAEERIKEERKEALQAVLSFSTEEQLERRFDALRRKFVARKIKLARAEVEDLFQVRHQLKADFERATKIGPGLGRRRDKSAVKGQLTTNTKKIDIHIFQNVAYWEHRYCQIYKTSEDESFEYEYVPYPREDIDAWQEFKLEKFGYPLWTDLRVDMKNEGSELISTADGCGSARVKFLALRLLVLDMDIARTLEEVDLLGVELERMKVYFEYQRHLLYNAYDEVETRLESFTTERPGQTPEWEQAEFAEYFTKHFIGEPTFNLSGLKRVIRDFRLKGNGVSMTDDAATEAWYEYCALHKRERDITKQIKELHREQNDPVLGRYGRDLVKWGKKRWLGGEPKKD